MNTFSARAVWTGLHWIGEFRCADHGEYHPVRIGENVATFGTKPEAEHAAQRALIAYMNGRLRRDGAKAEAVTAANELFRKGRRIPIERRRAHG